jgi:DNA repair protein SbcD/Mre11
MDALKTYLNNREDLQDIAASMLEIADQLLSKDDEIWTEENETKQPVNPQIATQDLQLKLI